MAEYQLGVKLTQEKIDDIESFLKTLDGQTPKILK